MKYILINFIVLLSLLNAIEEKREFIYIKPLAIEYNIINQEIEEEVKEVNLTEDVADESVKNMWANPMEEPFNEEEEYVEDEDSNTTQEIQTTTQKSSSRCQRFIKGFTVDKDGCPQTYRLKTKFENKKAIAVAGMSEELKDFSEFLKKYTSYQVIIYGYTDSIGEEDENKRLTQERTKAIKKVLMDLGVSSTKLTAIGKGEKEPIESNMQKAGRIKNNRIEIELIY